MFAFIQSAVAAVTSFSVTGFWSSIKSFLGFGEVPAATAEEEEGAAADAEAVVADEAAVVEEAAAADEPVETVSLWASIVAFFRNLFNFEQADKAAEEATAADAEVVVETPVADEVVAA